ncbi:alpha/beta hydrolase [Kordiimonas aquimaris]|uniref:alpha/beta hydrolase n=1 Tax=Kordiimonas aquimaris TaxID=707591 RepID=UPI0021CFBE40|nr:alpha/beta hydrolase-fold protein [Kordiimonas aquimaris]
MLRYNIILALIFSVFTASHTAYAAGKLSDNQRIESAQLGYALQYRVYTPEGIETLENIPTIYMTDGQWYIKSGKMVKELDRLIAKGAIKPTIAVFVDNRDPDNLRNNRRNQQFFCNPDYVKFFTNELVPTVTDNYPTSQARDDRVILGLSFGGLNAACFGLMAHPTFGGIAMQSPATHPVPKLFDVYQSEDTRPIKIFFSTGTKNDNAGASRRFRTVLKEKGYEMMYKEVPYGHNWRNWKPLLDDILLYYFAT